jgi:predicted ATP-dependent serine protease
MAFKQPTGQRTPMSSEAKARIAEAVRLAAIRKKQEQSFRQDIHPVVDSFIDKPIELVRMKDQKFSDDLFVPMKTGKPVDFLFSNEGGVPKACNFMLIGDPGVGKSTVSMDILSDLAESGYKVLFISAEMTRIDLYGYVKRYEKFGNLDILFTGEYCDSNPKSVLENALKPGFDVVLIDSFAEVQEDIKEVLKYSSTGSEKFLIDLMLSHNMGNNDSGLNTTFIAIQQVTKGGVFVGSNKLKHNTTGMLELRFDQDTGTQFLVFTKNRRGPVLKRMFYSLSETGDVRYDDRRFNNEENAREALQTERTLIESEASVFDRLIFGEEETQES